MMYSYVPSPLGDLLVVRDDDSDALVGLYLPTGRHATALRPRWHRDDGRWFLHGCFD